MMTKLIHKIDLHMASLTDGDKTQLEQFAQYLFSRQAIIMDRWLTECSPDKAFLPFISLPREEFKDQLLQRLHLLIQCIESDLQASDLVEQVGRLFTWQSGYSLAEWIMAVDSFQGILGEQVQQFLELHPQTQHRVITHIYYQLHRLSKEVNRGSITHHEQLEQTKTDEPAQALRIALDSLQKLSKQRANHLQRFAHDLRSNYGIISSAASLLQWPLQDEDRVKYMDMLNRNVNVAQQLLDQLLAYAQSEEDNAS